MAYLKRNDISQIIDMVRKSNTNQSVLLLVAPTVDAICALKILTTLLTSEFIQFKVEPVSSYGELSKLNASLFGKDISFLGISTIILIECGGTIDLGKLLIPPKHVNIFILDSHRPIALENILGNSQILYLDDGFIMEHEKDLKDAFKALSFPLDEEFNEEEDSNDSEIENLDPRREQILKEKKESYHEKQLLREKLLDYYDSTWNGEPSSRLALEIADSFHKIDNSVLWLGILGCLETYLMERIDSVEYKDQYEYLKTHSIRLNPDTIPLSSQSSFGSSPDSNNASRIVVNSNKEGRIKSESEFRFLLMRHWNIQDAMRHSRYIVGKFQTWRERGKRRLSELFATMGIPLDACQKDYMVMNSRFKREFNQKITRHASQYGIEEVKYLSFVREFGYEMTLSASDVVYSLMAIMEKPISQQDEQGSLWRNNFPVAFSAVSESNCFSLIRNGFDLAIKQHKILVHELNSVLNHRLIRYGKRFRYAVLRNGTDLAWFTSPHSLIKLAHFIVEAEKNTRKGQIPLLMAAYQPNLDTFLAVGVNSDNTQSNVFGGAFRKAANEINARVRHDGFDSTLIEIANDDLKPFITTLQSFI